MERRVCGYEQRYIFIRNPIQRFLRRQYLGKLDGTANGIKLGNKRFAHRQPSDYARLLQAIQDTDARHGGQLILLRLGYFLEYCPKEHAADRAYNGYCKPCRIQLAKRDTRLVRRYCRNKRDKLLPFANGDFDRWFDMVGIFHNRLIYEQNRCGRPAKHPRNILSLQGMYGRHAFRILRLLLQ